MLSIQQPLQATMSIYHVPGFPQKMSISELCALLANRHFLGQPVFNYIENQNIFYEKLVNYHFVPGH